MKLLPLADTMYRVLFGLLSRDTQTALRELHQRFIVQLPHYRSVFTLPAIFYRLYASTFIFISGLKYLKVDILRAGSPSFLAGEEPGLQATK